MGPRVCVEVDGGSDRQDTQLSKVEMQGHRRERIQGEAVNDDNRMQWYRGSTAKPGNERMIVLQQYVSGMYADGCLDLLREYCVARGTLTRLSL
jgi:hypothetical protein